MEKSENRQTRRELLLAETPVPGLILKMAVPTIVAFLINSIYSLTDTYFVHFLGTNATAAVSVNASLDQLIMLAIPIMRGMMKRVKEAESQAALEANAWSGI